MKRLALFLLPVCLLAQTEPKPAEAPAKPPAEQSKPAAEESKPAAEESKPAADTPAVEPGVRGSVEVGYRFLGDIRGNSDVYRSVVNLGEGPRLLNLDLSMAPSLKWIDDLTVRANSWGGDPYNSAYLRVGKQNAYRLEVDYRNIAYFNALPSFANPNLERGLLQSQRTFDMTRRYADVYLELLPSNRVIPFVGFRQDSGEGRGVTLFVPSLNEYPVPNDLRDRTLTYRTGVRLEWDRVHATVEGGQFWFKDDQRVYGPAARNTGNRTTPFFGQQLFLSNVQQQYGVRGDAAYARVSVTANPASTVDLHANWTYTMPKITTNFIENATGQFAQNVPLAFFMTEQQLFNAVSKQPHNRASFGGELRPVSRVRTIYSFYTDRLHTNSNGTGTQTLGTLQQATRPADRLVMNYSQHQIEGLLEVTDALTLRGGYRFTWGDLLTRAPQTSGIPGLEGGKLRRSTGLGGVSYRLGQKFGANLDTEFASTDRAYYRTSLMDYQRVRTRVRYQPFTAWSFMWSGSILNNQTPNQQILPRLNDYDLLTLENAFSFVFAPGGGNRIRATGEYARQVWHSNVLYLAPQTLTPELSEYRENAHAANLMVDVSPLKGRSPRLTVGGSMFRSAGSRPTRFYQPVVRAGFPIARHVEFSGEWRWWGMSEPFYQFENFRNHQGTISLRIYQ